MRERNISGSTCLHKRVTSLVGRSYDSVKWHVESTGYKTITLTWVGKTRDVGVQNWGYSSQRSNILPRQIGGQFPAPVTSVLSWYSWFYATGTRHRQDFTFLERSHRYFTRHPSPPLFWRRFRGDGTRHFPCFSLIFLLLRSILPFWKGYTDIWCWLTKPAPITRHLPCFDVDLEVTGTHHLHSDPIFLLLSDRHPSPSRKGIK